jgi:hypothetical protein
MYGVILRKKWSGKEWKPYFDIDKTTLGYLLFVIYIICATYYGMDQLIIGNLTNWSPNLYNGGAWNLVRGDYKGTGYYWISYGIINFIVIGFPTALVMSTKFRKRFRKEFTTDVATIL